MSTSKATRETVRLDVVSGGKRTRGSPRVVQIKLGFPASPLPYGRRKCDGPFSAEHFRDDVLIPELRAGSVEILLVGHDGMAVSFVEEAFGRLVECSGIDAQRLEQLLTISAGEECHLLIIPEIWRHIRGQRR